MVGNFLESSFRGTKNQTIINVNENDTILTYKKTFVDATLTEANTEEIVCQMIVPVMACLFEAIHVFQ
jgi:hypothetical protein